MLIDVIFDAVCPWCYIGKRRFERALERRKDQSVALSFRAFILNPEFPASGLPWRDYLRLKFGDSRRIARTLEAVEAAAAAENIPIRFDKIKRAPNTLLAHRLIKLGETAHRQSALVDAVFRAHFSEGRDVGDRNVIRDIGTERGLNRREIESRLADHAGAEAVLRESARAHSLGLNGVPGFLFDSELAIAGAQDVDIFAKMIDVAATLTSAPAVSRR